MGITDLLFRKRMYKFGRKNGVRYRELSGRNYLFPTFDNDQQILLLLFGAKDKILSDKFIQAVCAEANIRYKTKKGKNLFSYKFQDPCFVPPNDNKLKEDIIKLKHLGLISSRIIRDPASLELKNAPRLTHVYTLTSEGFLNLKRLELNDREADAQRLFKEILNESKDWHDAVYLYQQHFLEN